MNFLIVVLDREVGVSPLIDTPTSPGTVAGPSLKRQRLRSTSEVTSSSAGPESALFELRHHQILCDLASKDDNSTRTSDTEWEASKSDEPSGTSAVKDFDDYPTVKSIIQLSRGWLVRLDMIFRHPFPTNYVKRGRTLFRLSYEYRLVGDPHLQLEDGELPSLPMKKTDIQMPLFISVTTLNRIFETPGSSGHW